MLHRDRRAPSIARALRAVTLAVLVATTTPALVHAQANTGTTAAGANRPGASTGSEISLAIGEQYAMPAGNIRNYAEGAPGIADIRVSSDGSQLRVVGQRPGTTTLTVIRNDGTQQAYTVTVFRAQGAVVREQLVQLLAGYNGVTINQIGGRLFLEGGVASEQQQRRVQQIAQIYQGQVESLVGIDPTIVERRINVRVDLYFVELSRNSSFAFGLNWPQFIGGSSATVNIPWVLSAGMGMTTGIGGATATAIINQPLPRLDIASGAGFARVHRQATLITANGNEARYHSGGELNFQIANGITVDIRRLEYGSTISVTPRFDPTTSRVDLRVEADLSDLSDSGGSSIPGRTVARVNTLVNLQLGQSIVLSGMRGRSSAASSTGIPWLSQLPLVGWLFGSQGRRDRDNEMVIFIVPTVIEGMSRQAEDRVAAALEAYESYGGVGGFGGGNLLGSGLPGNLVPRPSRSVPVPTTTAPGPASESESVPSDTLPTTGRGRRR